jgi:electron transfer flavoprotein beta subunit
MSGELPRVTGGVGALHIVVCVKQTFDTEERIILKDGSISESGVKWIMNPYDEYAVEEAVRIKEKSGCTATVVTVGDSGTEQTLRTALAMGADEAIRVELDGIKQKPDGFVISTLLAQTLRKLTPADLILTGYMGVDGGEGQVGPRLAELLGMPHISTAIRLELEGEQARVERDAEGDTETILAQLPLVITAQQGLNEPRYPSLPGIMKAKKKPLQVFTLEQLGLKQEELNARTRCVELSLPKPKAAGKILEGDIGDQVKCLADLVIKEAKII